MEHGTVKEEEEKEEEVKEKEVEEEEGSRGKCPLVLVALVPRRSN